MIDDTFFVDCRNLPDDMRQSLDRPWRFLGDWPDVRAHFLKVACNRCRWEDRPLNDFSCADYAIEAHKFYTADKLLIVVWWGQCPVCGEVSWARQRPPYQMLPAPAAEKWG